MKKKLLSFALAGLMTLSATTAMPMQAFASSSQDIDIINSDCSTFVSIHDVLYYGGPHIWADGTLDITPEVIKRYLNLDIFWHHIDDGSAGTTSLMVHLIHTETKEHYYFGLDAAPGGGIMHGLELDPRMTPGEYYVTVSHVGMDIGGQPATRPVLVRGRIYSEFFWECPLI